MVFSGVEILRVDDELSVVCVPWLALESQAHPRDFCLRAYLQSKRASAVVVAAGFTEGFEVGTLRHGFKAREATQRRSVASHDLSICASRTLNLPSKLRVSGLVGSALVPLYLVCLVEMFDCHQAPELLTKGASPASDMFAYGRSVQVIYQLRQELQHEVPADQVRSQGVSPAAGASCNASTFAQLPQWQRPSGCFSDYCK